MTRAAIILAALVLLAGCDGDRVPEASAAVGVGYQIDRLFTHDGCTVYRFSDKGAARYFTRCDGAKSSDASWVDSVQCGKTRCDDPHSVPTVLREVRP